MFYTKTKELTMMQNILEKLAEMFPKQNYQSKLEQYINSKHPQSAADIEHWIRRYDQEASKWSWSLWNV